VLQVQKRGNTHHDNFYDHHIDQYDHYIDVYIYLDHKGSLREL
jgi:hypothetical protein